MWNPTQHLPNTRSKKASTPQIKPIPGQEDRMIKNNAGAYSYSTDDWNQFLRFLILGTEGGTYYVSEKKLTKDAAMATLRVISANPEKAAQTIAEVSDSGRAAKNDPAIFALAMLASNPNPKARALAFNILPKVCRIPTHLFHFITYAQEFRGWGMGLRKAVAEWYHRWPVDKLAYEMVKYQSRDGFSNRDVLRLAHVKPVNGEYNSVFKWIVKGNEAVNENTVLDVPSIIIAFENAKKAQTVKEIVYLIDRFNLSREMIPTQFLNERVVWEKLLQRMPVTAMLRSLGKMTSVGLLDAKKGALSPEVAHVIQTFTNVDILKKGRVHPVNLLNALKVYAQGHGEKGSLTWTPVNAITDALDSAFYLAFGAVEPTNKGLLLACDVSGSMGGPNIAGTALTPRDMTAALALVTMNVEKQYQIVGFTSSAKPRLAYSSYGGDGIVPLEISPKDRLDKVVKYMGSLPFGGTDCALPMIYAKKTRLAVDGFIILTDSETWAGTPHPSQALKDYRKVANRQSKMVVVGMTATNITIADPKDPGSLDVAGCDTNTPNVISQFIRE